jgi:hypothetical protein
LKSGRIEEYGQSVHVVSLPKEGVWSLRLVHPDAPFKGRPAVPGRTWTTEIAIARYGANLRLGLRVICASLPYGRDEITMTRPGVVVSLSRRFALCDFPPVSGEPRRLDGTAGWDDPRHAAGVVVQHVARNQVFVPASPPGSVAPVRRIVFRLPAPEEVCLT